MGSKDIVRTPKGPDRVLRSVDTGLVTPDLGCEDSATAPTLSSPTVNYPYNMVGHEYQCPGPKGVRLQWWHGPFNPTVHIRTSGGGSGSPLTISFAGSKPLVSLRSSSYPLALLTDPHPRRRMSAAGDKVVVSLVWALGWTLLTGLRFSSKFAISRPSQAS
jgi:hypothetical protein